MVRALFVTMLLAVFAPIVVLASTTDGTIDGTNKYAWGENIGWINLGTSGGNVHVTDSAITGYGWSEHFGWINFSPTGSGVINNGEGHLSGSAWGENLGYIDFSGVTIDSSGNFSGMASGTISGRINFDCAHCAVTTDWRPASTRGGSGGGSSGGSSGGGGGTGGGGGAAPVTLGVWIEGNAPSVTNSTVLLQFSYDPSIAEIEVSHFSDFRDAVREPIHPTKQWSLCAAGTNCSDGVYTVYVRFYGVGGVPYGPYTDSVYYGVPPAVHPPVVPPPTGPAPSGQGTGEPAGGLSNLLGSIGNILGRFLPDFLRPHEPPVVAVQPPFVPVEAPLAFRSRWNILPQPEINQFVFAPLPSEFALLLNKFPELQRVAKDIGIARESDLQKLYGITLSVPGITGASLEKSFALASSTKPGELEKLRAVVLQIPGFTPSVLPGVKVAGGKIALPPGIPVTDLPVELKQSIPSDVLFARTGDEKFDLDIGVRLSSQGTVEQQVNAVAGQPLKLVVRPQYPAERVTGYLAFSSRGAKQTSFNAPRLSSMLGSMISQTPDSNGTQPDGRLRFLRGFASIFDTILGKATPIPNTEERFTLSEFPYTDPDGDGIYTATIQTPVVDGNYTVYTIITYKDPNIPNHEIKLTAVIDPEGYVYEQIAGKETRIPGAVVSIYGLNQETNKYELWPADNYGQENPQTTDVRGTYAFLVPPGYYYVTVDAPGYDQYMSKPFNVAAGTSGVHTNIRLSTKYGWLKAMDWKTFLLILVTMLLLYNFYRDRRRDALERRLKATS